MKTVVFVRTYYDVPTFYSFHWCQPVIDLSKEKSFRVIVVEGEKVVKPEIESRLSTLKPSFIMLSGHCTENSFQGHNGIDVIGLDNSSCLQGSVVYARCCNCLVALGQKAIENECKAFVGYFKNFWLAKQNEMQTRPLEDLVSKPFFEAANAVPVSLLKGSTVQEALDHSHKVATSAIKAAIYSGDPVIQASLPALVSNDSCLEAAGDKTTRI